MWPALLLILAAYLVGSIPSGYLLMKFLRGIDVRQHGSSNIGAINVFRTGGLWLGILTLLADTAKGTAAALVPWSLRQPDWAIAAACFAALLGHAFSFWLYLRERRFSEGKCVATSIGVLVGLALAGILSWWVPTGLLAFWVCGLVLPKLVTGRWWKISPVTMASAAGMTVAVILDRPGITFICLAAAMSLLVLVRHKHNIERLLAGTEPRIGERRQQVQSG